MKSVAMLITTLFFSLITLAGIGGYNGTTNLGIFDTVKCSSGLTCTKQGGKLNIVSNGGGGGIAPLAAVTGTLTSSDCGKIYYNTAAAVMTLPLASTVLGCSFTFVTLNASNYDVNPNDADQILVLTNATGDAIRNATIGNAIVLKAVLANKWVQIGGQGTWTDIN